MLPHYEKSEDREAGKILAASYAALSDWSSALIYLERLLAQATEISVLNQTAECYIKLTQTDKAIPLLEKSLSLNPDQAAIRDLLEKIRQTIKK